MKYLKIKTSEWRDGPLPHVGDSIEWPHSLSGFAIVLQRVDHFDYEADLQGESKLVSVGLWCAL